MTPDQKTDLKLNVVGKIPDVLLDNTDRNRTSPFAFTGNKFELRAAGSASNCAQPMTVLNSAMAQQLIEFKTDVDGLIDNDGLKKDEAIFSVLKRYIKESKTIRFEGDGYGDAWKEEAEKRGLTNEPSTPRALDAYVSEQSLSLFKHLGVMSHREAEARHEILLESYFMKIQIESRVLGDLAGNHIVPTAIKYQNVLIDNVQRLKDIMDSETFERVAKEQLEMIKDISARISNILGSKEAMVQERKNANLMDDMRDRAIAYHDNVKPYFEVIRYESDKLELMIDDEQWPLPKFREMLYTR
jgi:glutamine synthetase